MEISIWWVRRDIRIEDNLALFRALESAYAVLPLFIFDREILAGMAPTDLRVEFLVREVDKLSGILADQGFDFRVETGIPLEVFKILTVKYTVRHVFASVDYEPYSIKRDQVIEEFLRTKDCCFHRLTDHVVFTPDRVIKENGTPYQVFTPYKKNWLKVLEADNINYYPSEKHLARLLPLNRPWKKIETVEGFIRQDFEFPSNEPDLVTITNYHLHRDFPGVQGTSRLGIHLRFGTLSIRKLTRLALDYNTTFLSELIWREYYQMILFFYPSVVTRSFRPEYDQIQWLNKDDDIAAWCNGQTGYPLVDAGIGELLATGYMHNRVRMVTASFLTKHLLVDWRFGEAFFAAHLLDYELASNNGGWQWAAGSGCDAAPYFRVFNPVLQAKRFDPQNIYSKRWITGFVSPDTYIKPIIEHGYARDRVLKAFRKGLSANGIDSLP